MEGGDTMTHKLSLTMGLSCCGAPAPLPKCTYNHLPYSLFSLLVPLIVGCKSVLPSHLIWTINNLQLLSKTKSFPMYLSCRTSQITPKQQKHQLSQYFWEKLRTSKGLGVLSSLCFFFFFQWKEYLLSSKGIFTQSFYGFLVLSLMLLFHELVLL